MTFDKIEHKKIAIDLINQANIMGAYVEIFFEFKKSVESATILSKDEDIIVEK